MVIYFRADFGQCIVLNTLHYGTVCLCFRLLLWSMWWNYSCEIETPVWFSCVTGRFHAAALHRLLNGFVCSTAKASYKESVVCAIANPFWMVKGSHQVQQAKKLLQQKQFCVSITELSGLLSVRKSSDNKWHHSVSTVPARVSTANLVSPHPVVGFQPQGNEPVGIF